MVVLRLTSHSMLHQIDPAVYEATLANAQANLQATKSLAERYKQLVSEQAVSKQEFDDANAKRLQAEASLKSAQIDLRYHKVLAPISGRIGRSISRAVNVSLVEGRPSRFRNPPGNFPAAEVRSR